MSDMLNLADRDLPNGLFVEASAGTGKTFSVAGIIVREIALDESLSISEILVTTFTRSAAAELRDRIRRRLVQTARELDARTNDNNDVVTAELLKGTDPEIADSINRLNRAVVEFDTTTISTIHAVCSKIITLAGDTGNMADEGEQDQIIAEVVNDHLVAQAHISPVLDEGKVISVVKKLVGEPLTSPWFDSSSVADLALMKRIHTVVTECVAKVEEKLQQSPSFDYLIRRAHTIVNGSGAESVLAEFQKRYRYLIVDEAQDTDAQQWEIFRGIFPEHATDKRALISVGDPKQSIYKFRGADIDAYVTERQKGITKKLATNYRSDGPVVDGLNDLFDTSTFGDGIDYEKVTVPPDHEKLQIKGVDAVEVVNVDATNQGELAPVVALRIAHYLHADPPITISVKDNAGEITERMLRPKDIVVLVRSGGFGRMVERELRKMNIPAVSAGTASVMESETAEHWRVLLRALERISDAGRVRHVLSTPFFGVSLTSPAVLHDGFIAVAQDRLAVWAEILRKEGVAALAAEMLADKGTIASLSSGLVGERRLTDFSHIVDLLNAETKGNGCSPTDALEAWIRINNIDAKSEVVSRRVESDSSAVQIMTIHVSKGLEFPLVVVADTWQEKLSNQDKKDPPVFRLPADLAEGTDRRVLDLGFVLNNVSAIATQCVAKDKADESARLLYVAATRAKHHVCIMKPNIKGVSVLDARFHAAALAGESPFVTIRHEEDFAPITGPLPTLKTSKEAKQSTAALPEPVVQTYRRTSFTGITEIHKSGSGASAASRADVRGGTDEDTATTTRVVGYADNKTPLGVPTMPMARIPGGAHIGKMLHSIYENVNPAHESLATHVEEVVQRFVLGKLWEEHGQNIVDGVVRTLGTPLGGPLGTHTLTSLGPQNRVAEMSFEMALAHFSQHVKVNQIGQLLVDELPEDDLLASYAQVLAGTAFDISLAGLINGSIDALLRIEDTPESSRFFISDYKSNRLDRAGDNTVISAYSQVRMMHEMEHHHYPLQALIYGTAVYRYLRWRAPQLDADSAIAGFAYMFIRGMVGAETPTDAHGNTSGVLTWTAPSGLWAKLSDLLGGPRS